MSGILEDNGLSVLRVRHHKFIDIGHSVFLLVLFSVIIIHFLHKFKHRNFIRLLVINIFAVFNSDDFAEHGAVEVNHRVNIAALSGKRDAGSAAEGMSHQTDFVGVGHGKNFYNRFCVIGFPIGIKTLAHFRPFHAIECEVFIGNSEPEPVLRQGENLLIAHAFLVDCHHVIDEVGIDNDGLAIGVLGEEGVMRVIERRHHIAVAGEFPISGVIALVITECAV